MSFLHAKTLNYQKPYDTHISLYEENKAKPFGMFQVLVNERQTSSFCISSLGIVIIM